MASLMCADRKLVRAIGRLERQQARERRVGIVVAVEELDPGRRLGVHRVDVGQLPEREDRPAVLVAATAAAPGGEQQLVADQVWLAGTADDRPVPTRARRPEQQRAVQRGVFRGGVRGRGPGERPAGHRHRTECSDAQRVPSAQLHCRLRFAPPLATAVH